MVDNSGGFGKSMFKEALNKCVQVCEPYSGGLVVSNFMTGCGIMTCGASG